MSPRYLLDTHIFVRFVSEPKKLSKDQLRVLREATNRGEPLAVSGMTLMEMAILFGRNGIKAKIPVEELFEAIIEHGCHVIPIDVDVASEVAAVGKVLTDPADRAIVATARVHRLKLVTSDQNIIDSGLVAVVE